MNVFLGMVLSVARIFIATTAHRHGRAAVKIHITYFICVILLRWLRKPKQFQLFLEIIYIYIYIYISHKTKGCDIWPPLKSQFGKRFLTGSIVLYSFLLLNVSKIYTNIS